MRGNNYANSRPSSAFRRLLQTQLRSRSGRYVRDGRLVSFLAYNIFESFSVLVFVYRALNVLLPPLSLSLFLFFRQPCRPCPVRWCLHSAVMGNETLSNSYAFIINDPRIETSRIRELTRQSNQIPGRSRPMDDTRQRESVWHFSDLISRSPSTILEISNVVYILFSCMYSARIGCDVNCNDLICLTFISVNKWIIVKLGQEFRRLFNVPLNLSHEL
jgi:hypothetical protein